MLSKRAGLPVGAGDCGSGYSLRKAEPVAGRGTSAGPDVAPRGGRACAAPPLPALCSPAAQSWRALRTPGQRITSRRALRQAEQQHKCLRKGLLRTSWPSGKRNMHCCDRYCWHWTCRHGKACSLPPGANACTSGINYRQKMVCNNADRQLSPPHTFSSPSTQG